VFVVGTYTRPAFCRSLLRPLVRIVYSRFKPSSESNSFSVAEVEFSIDDGCGIGSQSRPPFDREKAPLDEGGEEASVPDERPFPNHAYHALLEPTASETERTVAARQINRHRPPEEPRSRPSCRTTSTYNIDTKHVVSPLQTFPEI
jgi:hypothetical protein